MTLEHHQSSGFPPPFPTIDALARWLYAQGVDTTGWGRNNAKTIEDLWQELQHGECTLQADPPLRVVHVVEVRIEQNDQYLIETEQHFADGRVRIRRRPPSEKMQATEEPHAAARRCLREELAVPPAAIHFSPQQIHTHKVRDESESYPNLTSEYTFYRVHAQVTGLPTTPFLTPNVAHVDGDPIVAHRWEWVAK